MHPSTSPTRVLTKSLLRLGVLSLLFAAGAMADDRDLLRDSSGDPYVFIVFDTSGSMHWTPACTEAQACTDIDPYDNMCTSECPFEEDTCKRICPDFGCVDYAFVDPPIFEEIIVDNSDSGSFQLVGTWGTGNSGTPWGNNYRHDNNNGKGNKSATFIPDVDVAATYQVYLWWSSDLPQDRRASNVPVDVVHKNGTSTVVVDQSADGDGGGDQWWLLGSFDFDPGTNGRVVVRNTGTDDTVVADAIRLTAINKPMPPPPCNRQWYRCQQPLCPTGDCFAPLNGDDPTSKFFQARQALYEVLDQVDNVQFGFGTYEQDNHHTKVKHWLYRVHDEDEDGDDDYDPITLEGGTVFPQLDAEEVFGTSEGEGWNCESQADHGCWIDDPDDLEPADVNDVWEMARIRRYPKLGREMDQSTHVVIREDGRNDRIYRITYSPLSSYDYGDDVIGVRISIRKCADPTPHQGTNVDVCSNGNSVEVNGSPTTIYYRLVSDFLAWDNGNAGRNPPEVGYFAQGATDIGAVSTCGGLEPNDDRFLNNSEDDTYYTYTSKWPTSTDPRGDTFSPRVDYFDIGDLVPLDWVPANDHSDLIRARLAPNTVNDPGAVPDYRTAIYFNDEVLDGTQPPFFINDDPHSNSRRRLRLKDESERTMVPFGSTPLGGSLASFRDWFVNWSAIAAGGADPDWGCRKKYVLVLTDGDETCYRANPPNNASNDNYNANEPCNLAGILNQSHNVDTFVVGFGLEGGGSLDCMAANGGTGEPIYPQNKDELVEALTNIFNQIKVESRAFASASIPAVQSSAADKIFLSSFTPLPAESIWPGEVDVFRQPLPLDDDGRPDTARKCDDNNPDLRSSCHLYELGEILLDQAPTESELASMPEDLMIGDGLDKRRVFYGRSNPRLYPPPADPADPLPPKLHPNPLRLFDLAPAPDPSNPAAPTPDWDEQVDNLVPSDYFITNPTPTPDELKDELLKVFHQVLKVKEKTIAGEPQPFEWVLGDIFHANPLAVSTPNDFSYFAGDLCGTDRPELAPPSNCTPSADLADPEEIYKLGYRQFVRRNIWRRRMLLVAANDGQLHAFETGTRTEATVAATGETISLFTDGTGKELFSYIPHPALPVVRDQGLGRKHIYSIDAPLSLRDVFIDPVLANGGAPRPADREWRTVVVGAMREGGDIFNSTQDVDGFLSSYFALDITEPDYLEPSKFRQEDPDPATGEPISGERVEELFPAPVDQVLPSCLKFDSDGEQITDARCNTLAGEAIPFPAELWVFNDTFYYDGDQVGQRGLWAFDEEVDDNVGGLAIAACPPDLATDGRPDGNCYPDLGDTWSRAIIGQIRVCEGTACDPTPADPADNDDIVTKHVAIFGGGMDPQNKSGAVTGNWLYMVDVETGELIYKRQLVPHDPSVPLGSAPSDPAVLDEDNDGIFDAVYIGTTAGYLYKVDLGALDANGNVPALESRTYSADEVLVRPFSAPGVPHSRFPDLGTSTPEITLTRIFDAAWEPFPIFDAGSVTVAGQTFRRPIYFPPALFLIRERDQYGLSFGTGDREDLWNVENGGVDARFFTIVDEGFDSSQVDTTPASPSACDPIELPLHEGCYTSFLFDASLTTAGGLPPANFLTTPLADRAGWVMEFPVDFRVTTEAFLISGILIFSAYDPEVIPATSADDACARTGTSFSFVVFAENADALAPLSDPTGQKSILDGSDRYKEIGDFTTAPFIDRTATKNPPNKGQQTKTLTEVQKALQAKLREAIKDRFPRGSRFNDAYNLLVGAFESSTGAQIYATIPIAMYPADWKEE